MKKFRLFRGLAAKPDKKNGGEQNRNGLGEASSSQNESEDKKTEGDYLDKAASRFSEQGFAKGMAAIRAGVRFVADLLSAFGARDKGHLNSLLFQ